MRRGNDNSLLVEDGKFIGVCLGADYTSEHEWGIKKTYRDFGVVDVLTETGILQTLGIKEKSKKLYGLDKRVIRQVPEGLFYKEFDTPNKDTFLMYWPISWGDKRNELPMEDIEKWFELNIWEPYTARTKGKKKIAEEVKPDALATSWDDGSWGIHTRGEESRKLLKELYEAILNKDCAIFLGGGHVFKNAGLSICIASRLPEEVTKMWYEADVDYENLQKASEATGIHEYLKEKFKDKYKYGAWYALSPKWAKELHSTKDGEVKTSYDVVYWLNPSDQQNNNFGWYTVEQLKQWAEGEGPIPKKNNKCG